MVNRRESMIFFVDDEPGVRKAVSQTLEYLENCQVMCFKDGEGCLNALDRDVPCHLLITDVNMPGIDGLTLLEMAQKLRPQLPVLLVTGYGDVPMAVSAIKKGAVDFIEKPLNEATFLPIVEAALAHGHFDDVLQEKSLTKTEIEILKQVGSGKSNKEVAFNLKRSVRTIENHRHRLMRKLNVSNTAELVNKAISMGFSGGK